MRHVPHRHCKQSLCVYAQYLQDTLGSLVQEVLGSTESHEVDSSVVSSRDDLRRRRDRLIDVCQRVWDSILQSHSALPMSAPFASVLRLSVS